MDDKDFKNGIEAFYVGTKVSRDFANDIMIPRLKGLLKPSKKEAIIINIYYRMFLWIDSLATLNDGKHFQVAAAGARVLFELLLDLKLIVEDKINDSVEKYYAFTEIEKARVSRNTLDYVNTNPDKGVNIQSIEKYLSGAGGKDRVDALVIKYWGKDKNGKPKIVRHWSGVNTAMRARNAKGMYYEFYIRTYPILSWNLHSAAGAGFLYMNEKGFNAVFGTAHRLTHQMFIEATFLVGKEFNFDKAEPKFSGWIKKLKLVPGLELVKKYRPDFDVEEVLNAI